MRPAGSSASRLWRRVVASAQAGAGGGSRKGRAAGSVTPQAARSRARPERSAARISGVSKGSRAAVWPSFHRRMQTPGAVRPARPRRWSAPARETRRVCKRGQAGGGLIGGNAAEAAIDDDADAIDGQRGFGDGGGEHDLAAAGLGGADGAVLLGGGELAVERGDVGIGGDAGGEAFGDAGDLALAGQEDEGGAGVLAQARRGWRR